MSREFCVYCGEPAMDKIGCCGENHFEEIYAFLCDDLNNRDYPYGVEWSYDKDGRDIIDVEWFATDEERIDFIESEGFTLPREVFEAKKKEYEEKQKELDEIDRQVKGASGIVYDPPMSETEQYLLDKEREEEYKSYDY